MRMKLCTSLTIIALAVSMTGCPGAGGFGLTLGIWLGQLTAFPEHAGLEFLPGGEANGFQHSALPVGAQVNFVGSMTWQQTGNVVTITQDTGTTIFTIVATLENSTFMTGTRTSSSNPNDSQPFTASKAPSENLQSSRVAPRGSL